MAVRHNEEIYPSHYHHWIPGICHSFLYKIIYNMRKKVQAYDEAHLLGARFPVSSACLIRFAVFTLDLSGCQMCSCQEWAFVSIQKLWELQVLWFFFFEMFFNVSDFQVPRHFWLCLEIKGYRGICHVSATGNSWGNCTDCQRWGLVWREGFGGGAKCVSGEKKTNLETWGI